ncbi:MAG: hypothetical protein NPIRA04_34680 [Nitrospirales bacterium]|nr:MAG: hypothetical protein NPIRA04_34680 [Nitrospirales bacterium]
MPDTNCDDAWPSKPYWWCSCCLLVGSLLFQGCTTVAIQPAQAVDHQKSRDILAALKLKEASIQNLKGLFHASITGSILPISKTIPGVVFYTRPNSIRLKGLTPVGGTFFQFIREDDIYRLMMPASGRFTTGNIQELGRTGDIGRVVSLSLRAMNVVLGKIQGLTLDRLQVYEDERGFRLDIPTISDEEHQDGDVSLMRLWVDKQRYDILYVEYLDQEEEMLMSIACQDFRRFSVLINSSESTIHLPFQIRAEDDRLSGSVTLTFQELAVNTGS